MSELLTAGEAANEPRMLLLEDWAAAHCQPAPSLWTLRRMAREGYFDPPAVKLGKSYYVERGARVVDPHRHQTLVDRLKRA